MSQEGEGTIQVRRALLSVSDKKGLVEFGRELSSLGIEIISTGGTARALRDAGIPVKEVSQVTGFPEMLDGRVKTLHPVIHGGILARRDIARHMGELRAHGIEPIDMVVVNLYPFEATVKARDCGYEEAIEQIDIGGPCLIRAAAKNHASVVVIVDPDDYERVVEEMKERGGKIHRRTSTELAVKAFERTSQYDGAIASWLKSNLENPKKA